MTVFLSEMHLWSMKSILYVEDKDIGVYQYHEKKDPEPQMKVGYLYEKQQLAECRNYPWVLKNKRPEKLRDTLKELEELMQNSQCVLSKWKSKDVCQLLFPSGILVSLSLSGPQLEQVVIDRTLMGKFISNTISDAVLTDTFMIFSFWEQSKLCFFQLSKKPNSPDVNKRLEKLSNFDFKISYIDIPGLGNRRKKRHLTINNVQNMVICWWSAAKDELWPWSPVSGKRERANLLLLKCEHGNLEILSYIHTDGDPLDVRFSMYNPHQFHTVEQSASADQKPMVDSCIYEYVRNKVHCVAITKIPLTSKAISCCRNITEDKLVLGCEDSSVVLYEAYRQVTLSTEAKLLPALMCCHPSAAIILIGSSQGELQLFDMALSPIKMQLLAEDFSPKSTLQFSENFEISSSLTQIQWAIPQDSSQDIDVLGIHDLLLFRFDKGPVGVLHFKTGVTPRGQLGLVEIIQEYIHQDEIYEAINILNGMNWNTVGHHCYVSLCAIINYLLRQKLTHIREAQLEATLGTFYAPTRPLSETTVLGYRDQISRYARRFFHHLLRHQRFEKAFLLAVDIGARDLFMDIHYFALDKGELALAEVAKKKANNIDTESITTRVEIPRHKNKEDNLREPVVDLRMTPQEQKVEGSLPPCSTSDDFLKYTTCNSSTSEVDKRECEFLTDFSTKLEMDKTACQTEVFQEVHEEEEIRGKSSIKVVHFGLV
ncbi:WD repeat-containing and planar cell polarity effector protein fritz homolog isoform X2 [Ahaetulla prasina]|uniref:WD repeat-containing and planar cell polarity effector protein fritz homolog isoform X2 n=1 Tax=Ahaetulla prasina TaxID=499056 RepID=UPI002647C433|nr:WD repeat-containing and planar cell polarity effector protein fritz homolog isoform X2 [Ahaetulla prasina]